MDNKGYWSLEGFLEKELPPKDPLIEGLLWRRDLVAFGGRRREGKTTFNSNLAMAAALGKEEFLGYKIPKPLRTFFFYLEDDGTEIQEKLSLTLGNSRVDGRFALMTRADFQELDILISVRDQIFKEHIISTCEEFKPDIIVIDNMAHLIEGDYNNSQAVHLIGKFAWDLALKCNASIIMPAHLRKRSPDEDNNLSLRKDTALYFENIMGSSHFVNSFGSLWAIERESSSQSCFVGGAQRYTGNYSISTMGLQEDGWFTITSDYNSRFSAAMTTKERVAAWSLLPNSGGEFTRAEAKTMITGASILAPNAFYEWWNNGLERQQLIVPTEGKKWRKA